MLVTEVRALGIATACVWRVSRLLVEFGRIGRLDVAAVRGDRALAGGWSAKLHDGRRFRGRRGRGGLCPSTGGGDQYRRNYDKLPHGYSTFLFWLMVSNDVSPAASRYCAIFW